MNAYIRKNYMSDHTEENQSITYDVIVNGCFEFLMRVENKFEEYDYKDEKTGELSYCSSCNYREAEGLLNGIKSIAINMVNNWE